MSTWKPQKGSVICFPVKEFMPYTIATNVIALNEGLRSQTPINVYFKPGHWKSNLLFCQIIKGMYYDLLLGFPLSIEGAKSVVGFSYLHWKFRRWTGCNSCYSSPANDNRKIWCWCTDSCQNREEKQKVRDRSIPYFQSHDHQEFKRISELKAVVKLLSKHK